MLESQNPFVEDIIKKIDFILIEKRESCTDEDVRRLKEARAILKDEILPKGELIPLDPETLLLILKFAALILKFFEQSAG